jgi:transposase
VPMSYDRFNHNVDRRVKTKAAPLQRVEVITGVERRREWTDEEKLAIIAESCQEGAVISDVARRHGLRPQQLFTWRNGLRKREAARRLCAGASGGMPAFAPVAIADERPAVAPVETPAVIAGAYQIEIVLGRATVRLHGGVDGKALAAVLSAVKAVA